MAIRGQVAQKKIEEVKELKELVDTYSVIGLVNIAKVPASALHDIRDNLRGDVIIRMFKKKIISRAFKKSDKENLMELLDRIEGISSLLFTNMNPIKLAQYMEEQAVKGYAKPGDTAPIEIEVKAGDTGLLPGPVISELSQYLGVAPMTKDGTIHIRNDKITHKPGDIIEEKQAQLLGRLDIKPMTIKLDFYCAYEDGSILPDEVLHLDVDKIVGDVQNAAAQAKSLAVALEIITEETIDPLMIKGIQSARAVGLELPIFIPELLESYFSKAAAQANTLNASAFGLEVSSGVEEESEPEEEEDEEEEEEEEEESSAGLGGLFG